MIHTKKYINYIRKYMKIPSYKGTFRIKYIFTFLLKKFALKEVH